MLCYSALFVEAGPQLISERDDQCILFGQHNETHVGRSVFLSAFGHLFYDCRRIFSIFLPFASSSTSLSKYLACFVKGFSISSIR